MHQPVKRFPGAIQIALLLWLISLTISVHAAKPIIYPVNIFEGITPCTTVNSPVLQIPADADCELMIWHLTLEQDPATGEPTIYTLVSTFGMSQPNTTGIRGGGTSLDLQGSWAILRGTANDPNATVYQLNPDDSQDAIAFVRLDDEHLHVLKQDMQMAVGNGGWSYTLNRTDRLPAPLDPALNDVTLEAAPITTTGNGSDVFGVFDGRMPCAELVYQFTQLPPNPACSKIKWRLYLYHDPETGTPTTYLFDGTETTREGSWTQTRGTAANPDAIVFRLAMNGTDRTLNLLRADDNNLLVLDDDLRLMLGDRLWSYTLSRVEVAT